jgi:hypothetical protein
MIHLVLEVLLLVTLLHIYMHICTACYELCGVRDFAISTLSHIPARVIGNDSSYLRLASTFAVETANLYYF